MNEVPVLQADIAVGLLLDGWVVGWAQMKELLNKTDRFGRALIETFAQGTRMSLSCVFHEWDDVTNGVLTTQAREYRIVPTGGNPARPIANKWINGICGELGTAQSFALILTAQAHTPSAINGPLSVSFPYVNMRGDQDVGLLFGPEHRVAAFSGDVFPYYDGDVPGGVTFAVSG